MRKLNLAKVYLLIYTVGWVVYSISVVGEIPLHSMNPYPAWLPLEVFVVVSVPAVLGYIAGRIDEFNRK